MPFLKTLSRFFPVILLLLLAEVSDCQAQTDTIVINNQKIPCSVKEVTQDVVKYTLPKEDALNSVYKNTVQKIIFKSGRIQTFAEATAYHSLNGVMDYDNVTLTAIESEVRGLFKLGEVTSRVKGATKLSNEEKIREKSIRRLKMEAAMLGANVVFLTNQQSQNGRVGLLGTKAMTNLSGICYSGTIPDYNKFKDLIGTKTNLYTATQFKLPLGDIEISKNEYHKSFIIRHLINNDGIIIIEADLQGVPVTKFQLVNFTDKSFSIVYQNDDTYYNILINI